MLDARRSQVYAGGYFLEDGYPRQEIEAGPYMLEEFLSKTRDYNRILLLGDATDTYGEKIKELRPYGTQTAPESIRYQDAAFRGEAGRQNICRKRRSGVQHGWSRIYASGRS